MTKRKPFQFKQFSVQDSISAMKVGTDAVLLGSWLDASHCQKILDIGTGSGIIALILAQRSDAIITTIDIDENSIKEAEINFKNSKWHHRLSAIHVSLQEYIRYSDLKFELVVSNPPFFSNSLSSPKREKSISKHDILLTHQTLISSVSKLLSESGRFCVILPHEAGNKFIKQALIENLYCNRKLEIIPIAGKKSNRVILEFSFKKRQVNISQLRIRERNMSYTKEYQGLTREFYLNF